MQSTYGKFKNNNIESLDAIGNSETLFFLRDENDTLFGIDKKQSSDHILILFENDDVKSIDYYKAITGKTYPPSMYPENDRRLKGFIWREKERPVDKDAIFIRDKMQPEPANKLQNTVLKEKIED